MPNSSNLSSALFSEIINESEMGILVVSTDNTIMFWNHWLEHTSGIPSQKAIGKSLNDVFEQQLPERLLTAIHNALNLGWASLLSQKLNKSPFPLYQSESDKQQDHKIDQLVYIKPLISQSSMCLIQINDVSKAVKREEVLNEIAIHAQANATRLRASEEKMRAIFESAQDAIITFEDDGNIGSFNHAAAELFKMTEAQFISGSMFSLIEELYLAKSAGVESISSYCKDYDIYQKVTELTGRHSDGSTFPLEFTLNSLETSNGKWYVAIMRDISERKSSEQRMEVLAKYDPLTGLINRGLFSDRLSQAIKKLERNNTNLLLMFLDLNRFKSINDSLGHVIGDELLKEVALRINKMVRTTDTVARLGSDEFTVIFENIDEIAVGGKIAEKIISQFSIPFQIQDNEFFSSISIGIASTNDASIAADDLLRQAATAMYRAKENGKNKFYFFTPEMNEISIRRLSLEADMRKAIEAKQLTLYLQPQWDPTEKRTIGAEALIRWHHPIRGSISPAQFIPLAEDCGYINEIGHWVFEESCRITKVIVAKGFKDFHLSVNLSPKEFAIDGAAERLIETIKKINVSAQNINIEITEGCIMNNINRSIDTLKTLSEAGFTISVDDFGTGYSSLAYLRQFPLDILKIDQSFVRDLPNNSDASVISEAILHLAHSLRLKVVAEGVENKDQFQFLTQNKCEYLQGYYIAKPMPAEEFLDWLSNYRQFN